MKMSCCVFLLVSLLYVVKSGIIKGACDADIDYESWQNKSPPSSDYSLLETHVFIRHGDRMIASPGICWNETTYSNLNAIQWNCSQTVNGQPSLTNDFDDSQAYPTNIQFGIRRFENTQFFPGNCIIGQLTTIGYQQHITNGLGLGKETKKRENTLPPFFQTQASPFFLY